MNKADCNYKYERYLSELPWDFSPILVANTLLSARDRSSKTISMEEMVTILGTISLADTNLKFITRKDLSILLKANELGNLPTDIAWLRKQTDNKTFNVYAIAFIKVTNESHEIEIKPFCFGCITCLDSPQDISDLNFTSSHEAMESKFWSIGLVLDGTKFSVPKYKNMVNGNAESEFKHNGWHGIYVLSTNQSEDRIYGVDTDFNLIKEHTLKAYEAWHKDRMRFGASWRADNTYA